MRRIGVEGILAACLLTATLWPACAEAQTERRFGPEPAVSDVRPLVDQASPFPLVETYLAVNPVNPDNLLASAMSTSAGEALVYGSWDGGATWRTVEGPTGRIFAGGDPMLAFDGSGRAYFSTIDPEIHVWRSASGGRSWKGPVVVGEGRAADRQWVAASPAGGRGLHPLHAVAKTPGRDGRDVLILSVSGDGGVTFAEPALVPVDSGYINAVTDLVVRKDGVAVLSYLANYGRLSAEPEVIRGHRWTMISEDHGRTWEGPFGVAANRQFGNRSWSLAMKGLGGGDMAVDRSGGPRHGTLYMTWAAVVDGRLQIVLARSPDGGRRWEEPVRVNDGGFGSNHSTPTVAVNRAGVVAVTWNDRRGDPDDLCFRHYVALSGDGGRSFGPNRAVSGRRSCFPARSRWLNGGDTQGLVALPDGSFRTVWSVGEGQNLRPWTAVIRSR